MTQYKGFISNKKKGNLSTVASTDVFVVEKPTQVTKSVTGISVEVDPNDPTQKIITVSFSDGSSLSDVFIDNEGNEYNHPLKAWVNKSNLSGAQVIANITVDSLGHPTNWTLRNITAADVGASSIGHTHNYENPLSFVGAGTTSVTRSGNTITITTSASTYTHPAKTWVDKSNLTGAAVISNISVDNLGHPTGWVTRNLTPANIGAESPLTFIGTGATTVNRSGNTVTINSTDQAGGTAYTHPSKSWTDKSNLSGAQVISNLTVDSLGHPTNWSTRTLTAADIGAAAASHTHNYDNYGAWHLQANGGSISLVGSGGVVNFIDGALTRPVRVGNTIKIDKLTKVPYTVGSNAGISFSSSFNTRWLTVGEGAVNGLMNISSGAIGDEIEGVWLGSGRLTIVPFGTGFSFVYADEFFTNTYPSGGVFGLKQISATQAVLFGKQIPIGL